MAAVTVRNLSDSTHRALKLRAARNGRSTEAEIRAILDATVHRGPGRDVGKLLHDWAMQHGGFELEIERDQTPAGGRVSFD